MARKKERITLTVIRVPRDEQKYMAAIRTLVRMARRDILREREEAKADQPTENRP